MGEHKWCSYCKHLLHLSAFGRHRTQGAQGYCKSCRSTIQKIDYINRREVYTKRSNKWKSLNPDKIAEKSRRQRFTVKGRLAALRCGARRRAVISKLPFDITNPYLLELVTATNLTCAITGIPFLFRAGIGQDPFAMSIDRIDPKQGYTVGNVRIVCWAVNASLNNWGLDIFDRIVEARHKFKNTLNTLRVV